MGTDDRQSDTADTGAMPWLGDLKKMAEKFTLPGFDIAALVEWQRKDMEALVEANRQASKASRRWSAGATRSCRRRSRNGRRR
ncbi:hypothetical protein CI1B_84270 [Bradyrhizobium ivorense]|uniref:Phasin domain-containing protein n=1 Tax=Bradyrhizobium ivorense TaxID=2511166 RepID=A0A508U1Y1_9BRAD|nr:hypothetical protein CI1B_84270 [Bradyrhizobium ivorense]